MTINDHLTLKGLFDGLGNAIIPPDPPRGGGVGPHKSQSRGDGILEPHRNISPVPFGSGLLVPADFSTAIPIPVFDVKGHQRKCPQPCSQHRYRYCGSEVPLGVILDDESSFETCDLNSKSKSSDLIEQLHSRRRQGR